MNVANHARRLDRRVLLKAGAASALINSVTGINNPAVAGEDGNRRSRGRREPSDLIVRASIHPAIGFARVGNSRDEFYLGPEIPGGGPIAPDGYKDPAGAIKRQAARFRVYGLNSNGEIVRELTEAEAEIKWTVHLANKKAAWYDFHTALDIPEAIPTKRRNASYQGSMRKDLVVDPGPRQVSGKRKHAVFNSGKFLGSRMYLGELRTDDQGRLLVLGGRGRSFSPAGNPLYTFANNEGWIDDTSDGPVMARVRLRDRELAVDPAWVVVGPPNYAPGIAACCCTLFDVVHQTMLDSGLVPGAGQVTFLADIFPIFQRLADLQWVNQGMLDRYGWGSPEDFLSLEYLARLSDPSPQNASFRQSLFARFRNPNYEVLQKGEDLLPPMYGDAITLPPTTPRAYHAFQPFQYQAIERWAAGDFVMGVAGPVVDELESLPISIQGAALDRAALEACLGDAFHPGCEVTWPIRHPQMYQSPYRLKHAIDPSLELSTKGEDDRDARHMKVRAGGQDEPRRASAVKLSNGREREEPDYGDMLTPEVVLAPTGPLDGSYPGSLSRWMAVPWQTDTISCNSGYQYQAEPVDFYLPTFWPARVPNHVMTERNYHDVLNESLSIEERRQAFGSREFFFRNLDDGNHLAALNQMVEQWPRLGVVTEQPGPDDSRFPAFFQVETDNELEV